MYIKVLVELSAFQIDKTFTYRVLDMYKDQIKVGIRVVVPFNNQKLEGFVLEIIDEIKSDFEIKDMLDIVDTEPILTNELLELGKFIASDTLATLISAYQVMLPRALKAKNGRNINIKYQKVVYIDNLNGVFTDKQQAIINKINEQGKALYSELLKINSSVNTLLKHGYLKIKEIEEYRDVLTSTCDYPRHKLNPEQEKVYTKIINSLGENKSFLLHGITGSGKTEIYMEVMEKVIKNGQQALLLVPEITLTNQILNRLQSRFSRLAVLHSGLSDGERYDEYRKIKRGEIDIVVGTRSSVFAPLNNLGVIIIDECHVDSYKQEVMPKYDAITISKWRSNYYNCPLVLASATPSLDLYARATKGIYELLTLNKRAGKAIVPQITICDMTKELKVGRTCFSKVLYDKINDKLKLGEQIILLQNRRGYASMITCHDCGYTMKCPNCDISLTYHKNKDLMRCHYCGYAAKMMMKCPNCGSDAIRELGNGTEKIEEEIKSLFKEAKVIRMDLDTTTKKGSHERIIEGFRKGDYDILLGTQMIAKGLDFPKVTLVGVLNADTSLFLPSYKSSENTYDLLSQVAGRAGRSEREGNVIIQTYNPDHYAITLASKNDYLAFYKEEMQYRLIGKYPPYFYLAEVIIKGKDYDLLSKETNKIKNILKSKMPDKEIIGPSVMMPFKINNMGRFHLLIKYKKEDNLKIILKELIDHYKANSKIKIDVSFNPYNV